MRSGRPPEPIAAGSKTTMSAAIPGAILPLSAMPKKPAGSEVMRRTASSSESAFLSRTQVPST